MLGCSLESVGRELSSLHWEIESERKAARAARHAEAAAAVEMEGIAAELAMTKAAIEDHEEGNKEMAVGR